MKQSEAGFGSVAVFGLIAVLILVGTVVYLSQAPQESDDTPAISQESLDEGIDGPRETNTDAAGGTMMAGDPRLDELSDAELAADGPNGEQDLPISLETTSDEPVTRETGTFEEFSPEKLSLAETGDVILFFHADWCPSCRALEDDINANVSQIPDGVHILKLDFDTETELKQRYGIVRQHTLVQVDANGGEIQKLTGLTNTLDQVLNQL